MPNVKTHQNISYEECLLTDKAHGCLACALGPVTEARSAACPGIGVMEVPVWWHSALIPVFISVYEDGYCVGVNSVLQYFFAALQIVYLQFNHFHIK